MPERCDPQRPRGAWVVSDRSVLRKAMVQSALNWFGGKQKLAAWIVSKLPPHEVYVEPFGGAASVLLAKPPSTLEVYNDIDGDLVHFWRVVRDESLYPRLVRRLELTPYSRAEYVDCRDHWAETDDPVERAARWFVAVSQGFSGQHPKAHPKKGWAHQVRARCGAGAESWLARVARLPEIHARLRMVQIECLDWREIFDRYDGPATCFYCDPPYVQATRRDGRYPHEMSDDDHRELVERLRSIQGTAVLSGYPNDIYRPLEDDGWHVWDRDIACSAAGHTRQSGIIGEGASWAKGQRRLERLWIGPPDRLPRMLW